VITNELEKAGIPVALITAMSMLGKQNGAGRVVAGAKISHPCGDPSLSREGDLGLRKRIVECALGALQTKVDSPTIFKQEIT
jgi:betaine reductase